MVVAPRRHPSPSSAAGASLGAVFTLAYVQPKAIGRSKNPYPRKPSHNSTITESRLSQMEFSQNDIPTSQNPVPGWYSCLECQDLGANCNGPSLRTLGNIASARAFHKALLKCRNIQLKRVAEVARDRISEATVYEYFSHAEKDFKWTTVFVICDVLISIWKHLYH